ncbi:MAG: DUF1351 domain-containing protein, partial [Alphaproteobacteria bacterium]
MALELIVTEKTIGSLAINYEQLKTELAQQLSHYKGYVVSETEIPTAKTTRASLNKVKTAIDDRRKELKREILKPYETVEIQAKELIKMIDDVSFVIDTQIKAFEDKEKEDKKNEIQALWDTLHCNKITLDRIFDEKWLNKGYKIATIEEELKDKILDIEGDLITIESLCSDKEQVLSLKAKYLIHLDFGKVIAEYNAEKQAKELLVKEKQSTEEHAPSSQEILDSLEKLEPPEEEENDKEPLLTLTFQVTETRERLMKLSKFLKDNNF